MQRPHFVVYITSEEVSPGAEITVERPALHPERGPGTHPAAPLHLIEPANLPLVRKVISRIVNRHPPGGSHNAAKAPDPTWRLAVATFGAAAALCLHVHLLCPIP